MNRTLTVAALIVTLLYANTACRKPSAPVDSRPHYTIAVFKFVSHPAINAMEDGFTDYLNRVPDIAGRTTIRTFNAEGSSANVPLLAGSIAGGKYDLAFVIGTPCAQSLKDKTTTLPIVLGGATDPVGTGLVRSAERPGGNITGTTDLPPFAKHLKVLRRLLPNVNSIGVIYNSVEPNSRLAVAALEKAASAGRYQVRPIPVTVPGDVGLALAAAANQVGALCLPTDNLVQANIETVVAAADRLKIPTFNCDRDSVKNGVLFSVAVDYRDLGILSAKIAADILLNGQHPAELPIKDLENPKLYLNVPKLARFNIVVPKDLLSTAEVISAR